MGFQDDYIAMEPLNMQEMPAGVYEEIRKTHKKNEQLRLELEKTKKQRTFSDSEIKEMEKIFNTSPDRAQYIVHYLQNPVPNNNYRAAFFIGEPGTGKTMMAKAIAYKMSLVGWDNKFIVSTSLLGEYRNQTAMNLQHELNIIEKSNKPTIFIIDEVNLFLENTDSKYHDTNATSRVLWRFLDKHKDNDQFFFIGTMSRVNRLSQSSIDKIGYSGVGFPGMYR